MNVSGRILLIVCLFACLLQATGHGNGHGDGHGSLTFVCKEGWRLYEGDCYLVLNTPMTRDHASATCKRQGGDLFIPRNQQQFFDLEDGLPDTFWTGIQKDTDGSWRAGDNSVSLQSISLWANYEPDESKGSCVFMDRMKGAGIQNCDMMDYFVCQYEACLEGFVPCALGGKCINASAAICDGVDDCVDKSDERNCSDSCKNFTKISADDTFGEFSSGVYEGIDCWWSFEAPVGKRIQLSVPNLPLELNCGYLHILTGSPSVAESREIEWLTGPVSEHDVYSDNNFLHVRLYARDLSPVVSPQTFNWTTDIPNIMREEEILQASSEYQSLMFPFSSESLGPEMLSLYWRITVPEGEVISYHITSMSGESMVVAPVYIKDGDMDTYHSRMTDAYYTSATSNLTVRMQYSNTISDYVLFYKSGCNITISSMKGRIFSPGDTLSTIPHELTCEWTMDAGQNLSRGMSVKFPNIDLAMDPRHPPVNKTTQDLLQVYLDNSSSPEAPPVVFANDVGNIIHAPGGKIKIRFESDVTLNSKAFEVIFGIDCEPLSLSEETIISPMDTFYGEEVMLSCPTGYQFSLEKYKDKASVNLTCDTSGFMIGNDVVIPQCQIRRCGTPPKINNGFILEATSTSYEGEASYGCNQGFTMDGSPNITCNSSGRWTPTPKCTSSQCSVSNDELTVENGGFEVEAGNNITGSFAEFGVVVKFYCNDGYELIGQLRTYCNTTSWDHDAPPICRKLKCLLPEVVNAEPLASPTIEFNTSTEIQCKPGYEGSQMVTCLFNQTLDKEVTCTNIDECNGTNSCDSSTTKCMDTEGSYTCECLDGYMRVDDFTCTDILECDDNKGGCDFTCVELPGGYECQCDVGYDLFTEDGLHGYMIPESETGLLAGDLYRYNHTCVKKLCPPLLDVPYGQYLARNLANFHFMDQVTLRCDDGYHITGLSDEVVQADVLCMSDGTWNSTLNCSARSCAIPDEPMYGMFDKTSVTFGEPITLTCNYSAEEQVMQKAMCIFDSGNMRLGGENINECPVIDCREPVLPDGGVYNGTAPSSTRFLDSPSFLFMCEPGYDRSGGSGNSTDSDLVVCQDNGRWSFGTLRCDGKKCTDPGTPVDAMQIVETYEIGKVLMYNCTRNGFKPLMGDVEKNYTCRYNNLTDTADWTDNLGRDNLPVCTDVTPPEVVTCPEDKEYFPMDTVMVTMPVFSDNFGINAESRSNYMETGDFIIGEQVFNYTVMDFENLMTSCLYTYRMLDRNDKPSLTCPSAVNVAIMSNNDGTQEVKNLTDYDSNATLNTDPTTFERTFSKIGSAQIARVSLTDGYGRTSECTFMIHFTAGTCFEELLIQDSNAVRSCASTDDGLTCNSTCKSNYIYNDGSTMKTFNCSGTNNWVYPNVSDIYCLPIQNPAYLADVKLEYNIGYPAQFCLEDFSSTIDQELSQFEANIAILPACDGVNWDITVSTPASSSGIFDFAVTLQLNLLSTDTTTADRDACINQVEMIGNPVFNITNNMLSCAAAGGSTSITVRTLQLTPPILSCTSPSYSLREDTDIGDVCVPCGPGYFYNGSNGCSKCPSGEYQDEIDQSQCKSCLAGTAPNADQIACDNTCPPGFSSSSGFHPCEACPVNQFWMDSSTCQNCPEPRRTVGLQGAVNSNACYEPCPAGSYSETGYDVDGCTDCPNGFYQPVEGMTSCLECSPKQSTDGTPKTSVNDCTDLASCSGYGCDSNGTEQCEYHFHRPVCKCNPGYHGSKCEMQYEICSYDPCTEGSTCNQGEDNKNFTCTCRTDLDDCKLLVKSTGQQSDGSVDAYTFSAVANQTECEEACLNNVQCLSALYTASGTAKFCFLYNTSDIPLTNATFEAVYLEKNCTSAFGGTRCEKDLIDDCETAGCSSESMCMDKVNGSECLCPTDGGFSGPLCTQAIDVCDPDPCKNGMCTAFGTVRYQCTCSEGYTGETCDTLINECMFNPGVCLYNGTCSPEVGDYSCECVEGFSGDNCENTPDFCSSNDCLGNVCYSSLEFSEGVCTCEGPLFENVDPFTCNKSSNPCDFLDCENGGTCSNSADGLTATCSCMTGFTGHACQHNIDDCFDLACSGRGTCNDEVGGFNCSCDAGFEGEKCENNTNDCPGNCVNGTCIDGVDTFTCNCIEGFTGVFCEIDIDECVSCPCQHGGNCTQGIASYTCDCPVGWTGDNCENALDNCVDNKCQNDGRCFSILEKSICRCEGGTQGEFCENPADICEILSDADLCQNDAVCENKDGSAVCQCQTEYIFERCYFLEGEESTDGGNGFFNFSGSDSADYCKEECLKLENCFGVAFYQMFCFFYNQTSIFPRSQVGSVLFDRVCPIDYSGDSCQFVKDHCAVEDTCQNNGQCSSISPRGFKCDCQEGYSGVVCQDAADPCEPDPCGNEATCRSTVTEYICQCPEGQVFIGSGCAAPKNRFGLLVNTLNGEETSCLATPFRLESNTFSLMMWVKFYAINMDAIALHLFSGSALIPKAEEANFDLKVRVDGIVAKHKDNPITALPYNTLFGDDLFDGEWHHVGIAVDTDGDMSSTIDARTSQDTANIGRSVMFNDSVQICLGKGVFAEYKNISVWDYYLSSGDFSLAKVNMFTPQKNPVQGWWNYLLQPSTIKLNSDLETSPAPDMTRIPPVLNCSGVVSPVEEVLGTLGNSFVSLGSLSDVQNNLMEIEENNPGLMFRHTLPNELSWGHHDGIVIGMNEYNNYDQCRFPVYVKYNDKCPLPREQGGTNNVQYTTCVSGDGVCSLSCMDSNKGVSAPLPRNMTCSKLGVYDTRHPFDDLVLPACNDKASPKYVITASMQFEFKISCAAIGDSLPDDVQQVITDSFKSLRNTTWTDICDDSACLNLHFITTQCSEDINTPNRFDLEFELQLNKKNLTYFGGGSVYAEDAMRMIIKLDEELSLAIFGEGVLLADTVTVMQSEVCTTEGNALIWENSTRVCVPCGPGRYYKGTRMDNDCVLCPRGMYQDELAQMMCKPCGNGTDGNPRTTYQMGAVNETECVEVCSPGKYYNEDDSMCMDCPRHYYQDEEGQNFCKPCDIRYKTISVGSNSSSECKKDCPAGQERDPVTEKCVNCTRGFWRSSEYDNCQPCQVGRTTMIGEFGISEEESCNMDNCPPGTYWNITAGKCLDCEFGTYQSESAMLMCDRCQKNYTTKMEKSISADNCTFYCATGYEVNESQVETCMPCERGKYKDNIGSTRFDMCQSCDAGKTTDVIAAVSSDNCSIPICGRGEVIVNGSCVECGKDTFSDVELPFTSTTCEPCSDPCDTCGNLYGTNKTGAVNQSECILYCPAGFELKNGDCMECQRGFFKDNSDDESRFGMCEACSPDGSRTTDFMGAIYVVNCTVPVCKAGQVVDGDNCTDCEENFYQAIEVPYTSTTCEACQPIGDVTTGTRLAGSNSSSDCLPICDGGKEFDNDTKTCVDCKMGTYKPASRKFDGCLPCNENYTTNGTGAMEASDCKIRNCQPGTFINETTDDCQVCPIGQYQDEPLKTSCKECGENLSTENEGANSSDACQVFCNPGLEGQPIPGTDEKRCEKCQEHFFKSEPGLAVCEECPPNYTSNENRTSCPDLFCYFGYQYNSSGDGSCDMCAEGFFKETKGNDDPCVQCEAGYTTNGTGQSVCSVRFCVPGEFFDNTTGDCSQCAIGFYKEVAGNQECTTCPVNKTTQGTGSKNVSECDLNICPIGQYRDVLEKNCTICAVNTFQDKIGQTSCQDCAVGFITLSPGSTDSSDCVPECQLGEQYIASSKTCTPCLEGTYKDTVGNELNACKDCPTDRTTVGTGSISNANCTETVCPVGFYGNSSTGTVVCHPCPIGQYTSQGGQRSCSLCDPTNTTLDIASDSPGDCVERCPAGHGYDVLAMECQPCPQGSFNDLTGDEPNICKVCPASLTNLRGGSAECDQPVVDPPETTGFITVTVVLVYQISIDNCNDAKFEVIGNQIETRVQEHFINLSRDEFSNSQNTLCDDLTCNKINVVLIRNSCSRLQNGRRRRQLDHNIQASTTFTNVSATLVDSQDREYSFGDVLSRVLETDKAELTPTAGSIVYNSFTRPVTVPICFPGQIVVSGVCEPCGAGYFESEGVCSPCPFDTYQNQTGQTSCIECPENTFIDGQESTSISACQSYCEANVLYCNNRGTCFVTGRRTARCECFENFNGAECQNKDEPQSNMPAILGAAIGGGGGLLFIILIVVGLYKYLSVSDKKKTNRLSQDFPDPSPENDWKMYDNFSMTGGSNIPRPIAPYPSVGYPALGYHPDTSFEDVGVYNAYSKRPSANGDADHDVFVWQA